MSENVNRLTYANWPLDLANDDVSLGLAELSQVVPSGVVATLTVPSTAAFLQTHHFSIMVGLRDPLTTIPSNRENFRVAVFDATTLTVISRSDSSRTHAVGEIVAPDFTADDARNNPGPMTATGSIPYLALSGNPAELLAGADRAFVVYDSGLPTVRAIQSADIPDLSASYATPGSVISYVSGAYVPLTRTVNGHALSANVTVSASDVGLGSVENAAASGLYVPLTRTVNGHALSADVTVTKSDLSLGNVENTALSTWAGSANLTTLGTIATGTWGGTAIAANKGGTGQTVYVVGDLLQASTTSALSTLAAVATGNVPISGGVGVVSSWGKVGLTTHVSGTLPVANGGTNASSAGITAFNNITGYTAAGATGTTSTNLVFSTSPTLVTPTLGAATATTLNGNTFTTGTYTLTGTAGKTLTFNNTITLAGTDAQTYTFPTTSATMARTDAANTFIGTQTITTLANTATIANVPGSITFSAAGGQSWQMHLNDGIFYTRTIALDFNNGDVIIGRGAPATLQMGADVNGSAVSQIIQAANGITGTDKTGGNFTLASGKGTGAGAVSSLIFQTPTVLTTGTTAQSLATRVTITSTAFTVAEALDFALGTTTGTKWGTATSQKQSFWNATPIVQPTTAIAAATFTANTSLIANDTATFDGYTIGQVVKALRNIGLLA